MPGEATVSIYLITGVVESLTRINGEPSIAIAWNGAFDNAGKKDIQRSHREVSECDIEALLR